MVSAKKTEPETTVAPAVEAEQAPPSMVIVDLPIDLIDPEPLNPNEESSETFSMLLASLSEDGFVEPLIVCPTDDRYIIVGGWHRWKAAKQLGLPTVPCLVRNWTREERLTRTVRFNNIGGEINHEKFTTLTEVLQREYQQNYDIQAALMGFDSTRDLLKCVEFNDQRQADGAAQAEAPAPQDSDVLKDLSATLNEILTRYGQTLSQGYLSFPFGGQVLMLVEVDADLKPLLDRLAKVATETKGTVGVLLTAILQDGLDAVTPEYMRENDTGR